MGWIEYIPSVVGKIGSFLYPTDPKIAYETGAGPVAWIPPEIPTGQLNIVEIEGVPIDLGNRGVTGIPFNAGEMGLPPMDANRAAAAAEEAKESSSPAPQYHPAFLKVYPSMHSCVQLQKHGHNNPDAVQGCQDFADRGDMSKLVFIQPEKDANPAIALIPKEIPQDAKSDLLKFLQYKEDTTYTLRDKAADWSQSLLNSFIGEGEKSGEAAGKAVGGGISGVLGGVGEGVGTGFREGLDFRSFDEKLDPLINPDPGAPKISGSIVLMVGGGILLLILLLKK